MQRRYVIILFTIYFFVFIIIKSYNIKILLINYQNYIGIPSCFFPFFSIPTLFHFLNFLYDSSISILV